MAGSTYGTIFRITTFGESHGKGIGGIIDGVPAGLEIDISRVQDDLNKRKPGQSAFTTSRKEDDKLEILSGIFEGKTLGTPIGFFIANKDSRSQDYENISTAFRPSHADFTYTKKYGIRDPRGGGRSSARETACRVVAGSIAKQILATLGIHFSTYVCKVGAIEINDLSFFNSEQIESSPIRCPHPEVSKKMEELILSVKNEGDTIGGIVQAIIEGVPAGLGEPVFDKLHAELGKAMLSINATKGFEVGSGFSSTENKGSEFNDEFTSLTTTKTNNSGGIQGGISNGMPIHFKVAFKPVSTLLQSQETIDENGEKVVIQPEGRHDPCVVPRAVPIVEAMAAIVILDFYLRNKSVTL
jgi:chorismate synthase